MSDSKTTRNRTARSRFARVGILCAAATAAMTLFALGHSPEAVHAQSGGFTASCSSIGNFGTVVVANCRNNAGVVARTDIEINPFIGNANGTLFFSLPAFGGFGASCRDIAVSEQGVLQAACTNNDGTSQRLTRLNLNDHISNFDGSLGFN